MVPNDSTAADAIACMSAFRVTSAAKALALPPAARISAATASASVELFATTKQLLNDLNLRALQELPSLQEIGALLEQDTAAAE